MARKKIVVAGSLAFDYIMDYPGIFSDNIMPDKIHKINLSFLLHTLKKQRGGTAGNIAYNLALLKSQAAVFATAGNDFKEYKKFLKRAGVDTSAIQMIKNKSTASAFIMTDKADNQITGFYAGAMSDSANYSLKNLRQKPDFVVISPNDPKAIVRQAEECQELNLPFMLDIGMQLPALTSDEVRKILQKAKILIGNDYEIDLLKNKSSLSDKDLLKQVEIIITTLGANGSIIKTQNKTFSIKPAKPKEVLDPTGAGDAYRAGFVSGFLRGFNLDVCGQMGAVAACYTIEKYGTTTHGFTMREFSKRYKENFQEEIRL